MMTIIKRILANVVDIAVFIALFVVSFLYVLPFISNFIGNETASAAIVLLLAIAVCALLQYPFLSVHQTLGKAFFKLKVESTNDQRPITPSIVFQREIFGKIATGYLLCLPVLFGKQGGHELTTETKIVDS